MVGDPGAVPEICREFQAIVDRVEQRAVALAQLERFAFYARAREAFAVVQTDVKRMMAYSSIGHTGFLMMAVLAYSTNEYSVLLFYLAVYALMNMGVFMLVDYVENRTGALNVQDYAIGLDLQPADLDPALERRRARRPGDAEQERFRSEWAKTGKKLDMGKSCVRFKRLDDLALDVIGATVKSLTVEAFIEQYEQSRAASNASKTRKKIPSKTNAQARKPKSGK